MIAIAGIYNKGIISLFRKVKTKKPVKVVVTFLEEDVVEIEIEINKDIKIKKFSFLEAIKATKNIKTSLSDALIEERRKEL